MNTNKSLRNLGKVELPWHRQSPCTKGSVQRPGPPCRWDTRRSSDSGSRTRRPLGPCIYACCVLRPDFLTCLLACLVAPPVVINMPGQLLVKRRGWSYNFLVTYLIIFLPLTTVPVTLFSRISWSAILGVLHVFIIVWIRSDWQLSAPAFMLVSLHIARRCYIEPSLAWVEQYYVCRSLKPRPSCVSKAFKIWSASGIWE